MLAAMNRLEVAAGEAYYLPAGTMHAIGPGILLCELQEPTSFSILAEYAAFGLDEAQATLGLGWQRALGAFDLAALGGERLAAMRPCPAQQRDGGERVFGAEAAPFFQAYRTRAAGRVSLGDPGFCVVLVVAGSGQIAWDGGADDAPPGSTWVVPDGAGALAFDGEAEILRCVPPSV
jgi:mannose-6-phosphate isomerase